AKSIGRGRGTPLLLKQYCCSSQHLGIKAVRQWDRQSETADYLKDLLNSLLY
ncbi:GL16353, partial [Drosophila persimilis]